LRLRSKKKSAFVRMFDAEVEAAARDMRKDINRQMWYGTVEKRYSRLRRLFHWKHTGEWHHIPEVEAWYDDCYECGQPVKHEGHEGYWSRHCAICGKYESSSTKPEGWHEPTLTELQEKHNKASSEMLGLKTMMGGGHFEIVPGPVDPRLAAFPVESVYNTGYEDARDLFKGD
jgi:hypothetical protein